MPKANATLSRFFDHWFRRIAQRLNTPSDGVAVVFGHSDGGENRVLFRTMQSPAVTGESLTIARTPALIDSVRSGCTQTLSLNRSWMLWSTKTAGGKEAISVASSKSGDVPSLLGTADTVGPIDLSLRPDDLLVLGWSGDGGSTAVSGGDGTRLTTATFTTPVDAGAPADDVAVVGGNSGYWIFTVRGGELSGEWRCGP